MQDWKQCICLSFRRCLVFRATVGQKVKCWSFLECSREVIFYIIIIIYIILYIFLWIYGEITTVNTLRTASGSLTVYPIDTTVRKLCPSLLLNLIIFSCQKWISYIFLNWEGVWIPWTLCRTECYPARWRVNLKWKKYAKDFDQAGR
jgi:hypothetical protein